MSTLKSSAEHLTLNADGSGNDIKFQSNATQVAAIDQSGNLTLSGTVDGVDIAARDAILTSTTTTAGAALPKAGGTMTGGLVSTSDITIGNAYISSGYSQFANLRVPNNGYIGTPTTVNALQIQSNGNIILTGTATATSFIGSGAGLTSVKAVNSGRKNIVINGGMRIDQRNGTDTINATGVTYNVDRWLGRGVSSAGVFTLTQDTNSPANFTNSLKATVTTADGSIGSGSSYRVQQVIEGNNAANLNWGTSAAQSVTLSFWVRSSVTGTFGGSVANGDYNRFNPYSYTISSANTWEYKTVTIAGDTSGTWATNSGLGIRINWSLGAGSSKIGTAGTWTSSSLEGVTGQTNLIATNSATFYLTGVQFETGSAATDFEHRSYGEDLALCQRYFYTPLYDIGGSRAQFCIDYLVSGGNNGWITFTVPFPVSMRGNATFSHSLTPAKFLSGGAPSNGQDKFSFYIQNQGYAGLVGNGSIATLSGGGQYHGTVGTYYCSPSSTSASHIFIGNGCTFQFNAEL